MFTPCHLLCVDPVLISVLTQSVRLSNDAEPTSDRSKRMVEKFALDFRLFTAVLPEFHGLCMVRVAPWSMQLFVSKT